jgi:nitrate/TMAO reductase-like tetraheme cytochrome c subunit
MIAGLWRWFWSPSAKFSLGTLLIAGGVGGVIFWGGFNTFMEYTNTLDFCVSCHEMETNVFQEYKKTAHYTNRTGVRVICSDCHVPKGWTAKLVRKIKATNELFHKFAGSIDTPEKFEAERLKMARECRNCHSFVAMDLDKQERRPREKHPTAMEEGKTCIDCHKGIAHKLPEGYEDD